MFDVECKCICTQARGVSTTMIFGFGIGMEGVWYWYGRGLVLVWKGFGDARSRFGVYCYSHCHYNCAIITALASYYIEFHFFFFGVLYSTLYYILYIHRRFFFHTLDMDHRRPSAHTSNIFRPNKIRRPFLVIIFYWYNALFSIVYSCENVLRLIFSDRLYFME